MDTPREISWLDTETQAVLQQIPPQKLAPPTTETFSVVVLCFNSDDCRRRVRAFDRVLRSTRIDAELQTKRKLPFVVKRELTAADAMLAQFELVCCGIVSVFISDAVISNAQPSYLAELYGSLVHADEFAKVSVRLLAVPEHPEGRAFVEQFIGDCVPALPHEMVAMRKKARIMSHWANKIGAKVELSSAHGQ